MKLYTFQSICIQCHLQLNIFDKLCEILIVFSGRKWNDEFQRLIEQTFDDTEAETLRAKQVRKLSKEFAETASQIGTSKIQTK